LNNLLAAPCTDSFGAAPIGVATFSPGVHCFTSTLQITGGGTWTLDAQNNPNAVFIFKVGSSMTVGGSSVVQLINGAQACNVFWAVQISATVNSSATFVGNILAGTSITALTNAHLFGRALAGAAISLDTNVVDATVCGVGGGACAVPAPTIRRPAR
jgi:hypothetical protein